MKLTLLFVATLSPFAEEKRPSFLFIPTNDQRRDAIGAVPSNN